MASGEEYYVKAYQDFKEMGIEGAAAQVLVEGLTAHPGSARLLELASGKAVAQPGLPQGDAKTERSGHAHRTPHPRIRWSSRKG